MAFISQDDTVSEDQSMFVAPSFMTSANDEDPYSGNGVSTIEIYPSTRRNILDDINNVENTVLPAPNEKESLSVFLRVKPNTEKELEIIKENQKLKAEESADIERIVSVESDYQLAMHAPKESQTYKNSMNGVGKMTHRYTFTHIFKPETSQQDIFMDVVKPKVKDFLGGQNQLVFTYGATSAGKTFTIQGTPDNAGIVPRAIDTLFNTVGDQQQASGVPLKPAGFSKVVRVTPSEMRQLKKEKEAVFRLGLDLQVQQGRRSPAEDFMSSQVSVGSQSSQSSQSSVLSSISSRDSLDLSRLDQLFPGLSSRDRESATVDVHDSNITYTIWISFAEIYNENIYDLLQKVPVSKQKTEKIRRNPLKLSDDRNGSTFVKGLREIRVANSDEAYQALMIGRENLHFSATRLNQNSSRSHCIFTIKVVRVADPNEPHLARVSLLSFCDLAGSERISKTHNTGDRQKEAGNINTSLLVLGRCIKAIRHNQTIKDAKKHQVVPYRESKLTRLFKTFFTGLGKASLLVCISQAQYLFDESIHVLKFASIASKVTIEQIKLPAPKPVRKNVSRFSTMVAGGKSFMGPSQSSRFDKSSFLGRGSIAWEAPRSSTARSTMIPGQVSVHFGSTISSNGSSGLMDLTEAEEGINPGEETVLTQGDTSVMDNTVVQTQYDSLLALVEDLKEKLIEEKKKNLKLEGDLREELCKEFNDMLVEVEGDWEQRLAVERERASELAEWRITEYSTAVRKEKKRKRDEDQEFGSEVELVRAQNMLEKKEKELEHVKEQMVDNESVVAALKATVKKSNDAQSKLQAENSKLQFELAEQKRFVCEKQKDLDKVKKSETEGETIDALREDLLKKDNEITDLNGLLQEAGEEFYEKQEEKAELEGIIKEKDEQITQQGILIQDLEGQLMESHVLLQEANNQLDEKEIKIEELEDAMETAPNKENVNELQYKIELLEENVEEEKERTKEAEDTVKKQMEKIGELLKVIEETPNSEEVSQLEESLKVQMQRANDAEELVAEQNKKMEELIDSLEKSPSPKDMKNLEKKLEEMSSELQTEKTKVEEITKRMRDKIVELGEVEENLESEVKKAAIAVKMAEEAKAAAEEANRIAELEKAAAKEAERVAEIEKTSAREADEKTFKVQEEKSELQRQKSKLLEEMAKLKENKLSVSQEFEADIECEELKSQIENLSRVNKEITKTSEALKNDNDRLKSELAEVNKCLDNLRQVQIKEKMEVSMNNMFDDSQSGESVDLDYRSEELKQAKAENEQLLSNNATLEQALNKAKEATSILQTELDTLKKFNIEVAAKNDVEKDEAFVKKELEIEELKKQYNWDKSALAKKELEIEELKKKHNLDRSALECAIKDLKVEFEEAKKSSELSLSKIQKQLVNNEEELKKNQTLLDDYKKKDCDNLKTAEVLQEKLQHLECEKKAKQEELTLRIESEGRVDSLEKEVATKDHYIKELEDIIVEKDFTITQLEEKQGESETDGANKYLELQTKCTKLEENTVIVSQLKDELKNKELSNKELVEKRADLEAKLCKAEEERSAIESKLNDELQISKQSFKKLEDDHTGLQIKLTQAEEDLKKAKELDKEWMEKNKQTREDLEKRVQALSKYSQKSAELFEKEEELIKLQSKHTQLEVEFEKVNQKVKSMTTELEESQDELKILKKSSKEAAREAGVHHETKSKNTELQKELERLKPLVDARQREEAALDLLREELASKGKEISNLQEKVEFLKANADAKDYEVTKAKDERDKLMAHYDGILKQKQQELTAEKQRSAEASKLKEAMARATPSKRDRDAEELKALREQLDQKEEKVADLKIQLLDLQKQMDEKGVAHEKESKRLKLANKKVIEEYKLANKELQKRLPLITKTTPSENENNRMDKSTLEADDSKTDDSLVEVTPNVVKKKTRGRGRGGGASRTYSSQASCEDSNTENDPDVSTDGYKLNRKPRVSRNKKTKKEVSFSEAPDTDKPKSRKTKLKSDSSLLTEKMCLSPVLESASATAGDAFTTPGPCSTKKKRKLYSLTPQHNEVFTPEEGDGNHDSPHSTVKKQLSVRRSMRRK